MKTTLAIVIVCAVFYAQAAVPLTSIKGEVEKALHKLVDVVEKAISQAQNVLDKAMNTVKSEATRLENNAKVELDKLLQPLRKKLDDLLEKAKIKGFDIAKCQSYISDFSNIPNSLVHDLTDCINQQISKAQGYVDDAMNNAKKIEQDVKNRKCHGNLFKKAKCYVKMLEKVIKDTVSLPKHIIEDVTKTATLVTSLVPTLELCSANQLKKAEEHANKDIANLAVCAAV